MKLTKRQIQKLKTLLNKAQKAEILARSIEEDLSKAITDFTGVDGFVDSLSGDGHGFTTCSDDNIHVSISFIIEQAEKGIDINEEFISNNLIF